MEPVAVAGVGRLLLLLGLSSGIGLPLGMPPLPEDPVWPRSRPEQCLFYAGWAGMAAPDPKSSNQTEQLLAEPEVQRLVAEAERLIKAAINKAASGKGPEAGGGGSRRGRTGKDADQPARGGLRLRREGPAGPAARRACGRDRQPRRRRRQGQSGC